jgi:predicted transcriptional regulator
MEVTFSADTQAKVNRGADANEGGQAEYVQQLVENYVDHDLWFREKVKQGLDQLDRDEFVSSEEMAARIEKMFPH